MLKSKECYHETAYVRAFFMHKGLVKDYLIDPMAGSFIRVITPHPDQPKTEKGWYNRPQCIIMNRGEQSRMYDVDDIIALMDKVENINSNPLSPANQNLSFGVNRVDTSMLTINSDSEIRFKTRDGSYATLVGGTSPNRYKDHVNHKFLNGDRYLRIVGNLYNALGRISRGEEPREKILVMKGEIFTTATRIDKGHRTPIIISGRKHEGQGEAYAIIFSNQQRLAIPLSQGLEMVVKYFESIKMICEELVQSGAGTGERKVQFIWGDNPIDSNMEYVNCQIVPFGSACHPFVVMNSDRYPSNTKFSFHYDREFVDTLGELLQEFLVKFAEVKV